jgi:hypothetical protein
VTGFGTHVDAALYKRGLDNTDRLYWNNYQYGTLAIAPTDALTLRLWQIGDEVSKGSHDAQYDTKALRSRGGAFIGRFAAGKDSKGNGIWRFSNGARTEFRSSEGGAYRLEGGQWWWITWDEWASQPDYEIYTIRNDVLLGRARDHDAKIMPMAWPKPKTEHHLISVIRDVESGRDQNSKIVYLDATNAPWTNQDALAVEVATKSPQEILRTIKGRPAGGASIEFKQEAVDNLVNKNLPRQELPISEGYAYFSSWDLGIGNDATAGFTFRIPIVGSKRLVSPQFKARMVNRTVLPGSDTRDLDDITMAYRAEQALYHSQGRRRRDRHGRAHGRPPDARPQPAAARVQEPQQRPDPRQHAARRDHQRDRLRHVGPARGPRARQGGPVGPDRDALLDRVDRPARSFDRDAKEATDDEAWAFMIGCWYIRRYWAVGTPGVHTARSFDVRPRESSVAVANRTRLTRDQRSRFIRTAPPSAPPPAVRLLPRRPPT